MKGKIATLMATAALLMLSATQLSAKPSKYIYVGLGYAHVIDDIVPKSHGVAFDFGGEYRGEDFYLGFDWNYYGNDPDNAYMSVGLKPGYMLQRDTVIYGTLMYNYQPVGGATGGSGGVLFGAGVKYQLFNHVGFNVNYNQATMDTAWGSNFDFKTVQVLIEYNFLSGKGGYLE